MYHVLQHQAEARGASEVCVCCLLMGRGELWLFCCVHWPTPPACSLIPTCTMLITHCPSSGSIKPEDTNPISAKAATVHGVMFALALLPAQRMLAWSSKSRTALRDDIHPDTKCGATTFPVQHISVTLALRPIPDWRSYYCGSDACSICTIDGSWSHLTPQTCFDLKKKISFE